MTNTVGGLRQQCALQDSRARVEIVSNDPKIQALGLVVVRTYPDTRNSAGEMVSTFKIEIARECDCGNAPWCCGNDEERP